MQEPASTTRVPGRLIAALPLLTAIASTVVLIVPVLSPKLQLYYRDTGRLYYPVKLYIAERLRHGGMPFWDPWTEAGVSLLAQISPGMLHPFTLLYLFLPFDLAFKLNHLLALPMAAAGAYWMARKLGTAPWPSAVAGVVFGCCGYLVSTAASNLPYALGPAGIPAACAALLWLCERPSAKRLLIAGALLALCNYAGEPQSALMAGIIGGCCALGMAAGGENMVWRDRFRRGLRAAGLTALWGGLALALSMPAVLPGGLRAHASPRWQGLTDVEQSLFSLHPVRLAALAMPEAFDDVSSEHRLSLYLSTFTEYFETSDKSSFADAIYIGFPAALLALFAMFCERRGRWLGIGAMILGLASTGTALGIHQALNRVVPGLGFFRYSEKLIAAVSLLIALGAARGAERALEGARSTAFKLVIASAWALGLVLLAWCWLAVYDNAFLEWLIIHGTFHLRSTAVDMLLELRSSLVLTSLLALAVGLIALHRALSPRASGFSSALAALSCLAALLISGGDLLFTCSTELLQTSPKLAQEMIRRAGPSEGRWRYFFDGHNTSSFMYYSWLDRRFGGMASLTDKLLPQFDSLYRVEGVEPYFSLLDARFLTVLNGAPDVIYRLFDVRFVFSPHSEMTARQASARGFVAFDDGWLGENKPRPRAFLTSHVYLPPPEGPMAMFRDAAFDPLRDVLALPAERALIGTVNVRPGEPGTAAMRRISPEQIEVDVEAPARRLLVVAEHHDPGWSATLDNEPTPVLMVDGMALGVAVPPGSHIVRLRFWPQGLTEACWIAGASLLFVVTAAFWEHRKRQIEAAR